MKRITFIILFLIVLSGNCFAATWYACGTTPTFSHVSGGTTSDVWNAAAACNGAWLDWSTGPATGDVFLANGVTGIIVDVDPKGTAGATSVVLNTATNGGTFVHTTGNLTITADLGVVTHTGTTDVLTWSGGNLILLGNIYGGGTTNADGLVMSGTGTLTIGSVGTPVVIKGGGSGATATSCTGATIANTGGSTIYADITGGPGNFSDGLKVSAASGTITITGAITGGPGTGTSAYGLDHTGNATVNSTGNCTGGATASSHGCVNVSATGVTTITGDCIATSTAAIYSCCGCWGSGAGGLVTTGNIVNTEVSTGAFGKVSWNPSTPKKYIKFLGGGSAIYIGRGTGNAAGDTFDTPGSSIIPRGYYIDYTDGTWDQGSFAIGGHLGLGIGAGTQP
jgi:hypothetical protein